MLHQVKQALKQGVRAVADRVAPESPNRMVENIGLDLTRTQKRVLLCYLDWATSSDQLRAGAKHTNYREMFQMVEVFTRRGWVVDACLCVQGDAVTEAKKDAYDVIFGFGDAFRKAAALNPKAAKILYTTENPYDVSAKNEQARIDYFEQRHGKKTGFARSGLYYRPGDVELADALVSLGEVHYYKHLKKPALRLYPTALCCPEYVFDPAPRPAANFVVLGADGVIHKGFDLLVDVFSRHPEWTLNYYGRNFTSDLHRLGYEKLPANVHDHGFVNVQSESFLPAAIDNCFILLPSCSEGCPTGVLTGMMHGLIPIVMRGNGMDALGDVAYYFDGYHLDEIEAALSAAAALPDSVRAERSKAAYTLARATFTLPHFTQSFSAALDELSAQGIL